MKSIFSLKFMVLQIAQTSPIHSWPTQHKTQKQPIKSIPSTCHNPTPKAHNIKCKEQLTNATPACWLLRQSDYALRTFIIHSHYTKIMALLNVSMSSKFTQIPPISSTKPLFTLTNPLVSFPGHSSPQVSTHCNL